MEKLESYIYNQRKKLSLLVDFLDRAIVYEGDEPQLVYANIVQQMNEEHRELIYLESLRENY